MDTQPELGSSSEGLGHKVHFLKPDQFDHYWPDFEKALDADPSLWNEDFSKESIRSGVLNETIQPWVVLEGEKIRVAFLTQRFVTRHNEMTLHVFWMVGHGLPKLAPLIAASLRYFAVELNCTKALITGRKGFEKLLKPLGMEYKYSVYGCDVHPERGH